MESLSLQNVSCVHEWFKDQAPFPVDVGYLLIHFGFGRLYRFIDPHTVEPDGLDYVLVILIVVGVRPGAQQVALGWYCRLSPLR